MLGLGLKTGKLQQVLHWRTNACPQVARLAQGFAGQGHHALDQGLTVDNGAFDRKGGADVLHEHANRGGVLAVRHFFACQDLGELLGATGRVLGRDHAQGNAGLVT